MNFAFNLRVLSELGGLA